MKILLIFIHILFSTILYAQKFPETPYFLTSAGVGYFVIPDKECNTRANIIFNGEINLKLVIGLYITTACQYLDKTNMVTTDYGFRYGWFNTPNSKLWWIGGGISKVTIKDNKRWYVEAGSILKSNRKSSFIITFNFKYNQILINANELNIGGILIMLGYGIKI